MSEITFLPNVRLIISIRCDRFMVSSCRRGAETTRTVIIPSFTMGREEAARYLQDMADHWAAKVTRDYKALGDRLLVKYLDGNIKKENPDGSFARTPEGMAVSPVFGGYNQEYFDNIVRHTGDHFKERPVPQK